MTIAERLEIAMRQNGVASAKQLSTMSGVSQTMISKILRDESSPTVGTLSMLCAGMEMTVEELYRIGDALSLDDQLGDAGFALDAEARELTDEDKLDVLEFIRFKKEKKKR